MDKIITLCGSTRFKKEFEKTIREETLKGNFVFSVAQFSHFDNLSVSNEEKEIFDRVHLNKIAISDMIIVIMVDNYIGESTKKEIEFANSLNKKIIYNNFTKEIDV